MELVVVVVVVVIGLEFGFRGSEEVLSPPLL